MAELVDALDLGSSGVTRAGSIPVSPTSGFPVYQESRLSIGFPVVPCLGVLAGSASDLASNEMIASDLASTFGPLGEP